jgi:hypothetical protein
MWTARICSSVCGIKMVAGACSDVVLLDFFDESPVGLVVPGIGISSCGLASINSRGWRY